MDFQSVNPLNVRLNKVSGNLLPMTDGSSFPIYWQIYSIVIWLLEITQISILIPGCFLVPTENALKDGMIGVAITFEVFFVVMRLHTCRGLIQRLIEKLNSIMLLDDELMRSTVRTTLKSMDIPLKFCWSAGVVSVILWCSPPYVLIFQKDRFFYLDYKMPVAFGTEPFSTAVFVVGSLIVSTSSAYIFTKKIAADTYMIHLILLVTAQYRYIALKLSLIIKDGCCPRNNLNTPVGKECYLEADRRTKKQIKALCQHHNAMLYVMLMLKELLSLNFSLIYVNNVFRFCAIAFMILVVSSTGFVEGSAVILYACGGMVQLYLLCYCVQQLLDAGVEITDNAFHEKWYEHGTFLRRTFIMMIMANNLECKLSRFEKFNLSLSSFMAILNQSYSIALLLLRTT
ncbi:uncharacterized protein LOC116842481 [Odontomachus brunneus]|uniref:uncharacterized protein LOC116842481 n=1 Tax=Odontomachus brunneus TaxID=486640 RepID=UPI0013F295FA|nr:uncharacterized protein LOC116842481 [Odontomachus brunneus]